MVDESFSVSEFSSLADKVASIDYILTKIFECLPLRSLVRFEAVSKHWFSLITDPQFSPLLKPRYASGLFLLPSKLQDEPFSCEVDFLPLNGINSPTPPFKRLRSVCESTDVKILHSCNGLLLCSSPRASGGDTDYFVCNPTTKKIVVLCRPADGPYGSWRGIRGLYLAYDPLKAPDYKVICVWRFAGDLLYKILIYSSETRVWRLSESDEYFYYSSKAHFDRGAYWNGAVHWHCDTDNWLYFNIEKEKLNIMPPPVKLEDGLLERPFVYFGESGGHLHVIEDYSQAAALYIYEMEIDYSGWYKKHEVRLDAIPAALPETTQLTDPTEEGITLLSVIRRERDDDSFLVLQVHGRIVQYSLGYEASRVLVDFDFDYDVYGGGRRSWGWCDAFQYIESLACV
ncbi:UNVERIFIED_CONTAM: F-box protein [Sesamum radiatum]|uniref:F-box protein n=1 Tax=Sesamum radiatum TaxID=300843 RepID=A0AAW2JUP9_SESRA